MRKFSSLLQSLIGTIFIMIVAFSFVPTLRFSPTMFIAFVGIAMGSVLFLHTFDTRKYLLVFGTSQLVLHSVVFLLTKYLLFDLSFNLQFAAIPITLSVSFGLVWYDSGKQKKYFVASVISLFCHILLVIFSGHFSLRALTGALSEIDKSFFLFLLLASSMGYYWFYLSEKDNKQSSILEELEAEEREEASKFDGQNETDIFPASDNDGPLDEKLKPEVQREGEDYSLQSEQEPHSSDTIRNNPYPPASPVSTIGEEDYSGRESNTESEAKNDETKKKGLPGSDNPLNQ